jgi:hypothetical protein
LISSSQQQQLWEIMDLFSDMMMSKVTCLHSFVGRARMKIFVFRFILEFSSLREFL